MRISFFAFLYCLIQVPLLAQNQSSVLFTAQPELIVEQAGKRLEMPWIGGLNSIQIAKMHLNEDAEEDLIVFDRSSSRLLTFIANPEEKRYEYAPQYENFFPDMRGWLILADYDQDGRKDLFTHSSFGAKLYRNLKSPAGNPEWQLIADPIYTQGYSRKINLQINVIDIPAIVDLDQDGDLDLITFDFAQGAFLEYHKNLSMERYGNASQVDFERVSKCWGKIYEGLDCGEFSFDFDCNESNQDGGGSGLPDRLKHVGSTIQLVDLNGDQVLDLLLGDVSCEAVYAFINEGSNLNPQFSQYREDFPSRQPIRLFFPSVFIEDLNFDGKADLLAASNLFNNIEQEADFSQSVLFYENIASSTSSEPDFSPVSSGFLQNAMIDLGEDSQPTFIDIDQDGDFDLLVGHKGNPKAGKLQASLYFYENTGSASKPYFTLRSQDYLGLKSQNIQHLRPIAQDINGDQKPDLLLQFEQEGTLVSQVFWQEQAALSSNAQAYPLPAELHDQALLADLDQDGDPDLLLAKKRGNLAYYENTGNLYAPNFVLRMEEVAGIKADSQNRFLRIALSDTDQDGELDLITANQLGHIKLYRNFKISEDKQESEEMIFYESDLEAIKAANFGQNISLSSVDLDQDQYPDLMLGNSAGGLIYLKNTSLTQGVIHQNWESPEEPKVYPNPSQGVVNIESSQSGHYQLLSLPEGKVLRSSSYKAGRQSLDFSHLSPGLYLIVLKEDNGKTYRHKLVFK